MQISYSRLAVPRYRSKSHGRGLRNANITKCTPCTRRHYHILRKSSDFFLFPAIVLFFVSFCFVFFFSFYFATLILPHCNFEISFHTSVQLFTNFSNVQQCRFDFELIRVLILYITSLIIFL